MMVQCTKVKHMLTLIRRGRGACSTIIITTIAIKVKIGFVQPLKRFQFPNKTSLTIAILQHKIELIIWFKRMHLIEHIEALLTDTLFGIFSLSEQGGPRKKLDLLLKIDYNIRARCQGKEK